MIRPSEKRFNNFRGKGIRQDQSIGSVFFYAPKAYPLPLSLYKIALIAACMLCLRLWPMALGVCVAGIERKIYLMSSTPILFLGGVR